MFKMHDSGYSYIIAINNIYTRWRFVSGASLFINARKMRWSCEGK